ncbi:hypothetical protein ABFA07_017191 [Porites harrisoni]
MASERIVIAGLFVFIFCQAFSSTAAEFEEPEDRQDIEPNSISEVGGCSGSSPTVGDGCTLSDDCSTITCKMDFVKKPITFKLKINKCDDPVTVTASMDVPDLDITWSHTYSSNDKIAVPGFSVSLPPIFSAGVYVQIDFTNNGDTLHLKVNLLAGAEDVYPIKFTVVEGDLPISTDDCGFFGWFIDLSLPAKIAVIAGTVVFLIAVCCGCCCYCCCRRRRSANQGPIIIAPGVGTSAVMTTNANTRVPMRPLVEEE